MSGQYPQQPYPPPAGAQYPGYPPGQAYSPPGQPGYAWPPPPAGAGYPGYPPPGAQPTYYPPPPGQQSGYAWGGPPPPGYPTNPDGTPAPPQPGYGWPASPPPPQGYQSPPQQPGYGWVTDAPPPAGYPASVQPSNATQSVALSARPTPPGVVWYSGVEIADPNLPPAALGSNRVAGYDPDGDYQKLKKVASRLWTDAVVVTDLLLRLNLLQREALRDYMVAKGGKSMNDYMQSYIDYESIKLVLPISLGPLLYDVSRLKHALPKLFGAEIWVLSELLLDRDPADLKLLISKFNSMLEKDLMEALKHKLSGKLEKLFVAAITVPRQPDTLPVDPKQVEMDVHALEAAAKKEDETAFIEVFVSRSRPHLAAVITSYQKTHSVTLRKAVKKAFSKDFEKALTHIYDGAKTKRSDPSVWRDAKKLQSALVGFTHEKFIPRLLTAQWNTTRFEAVRAAFEARAGEALEHRISNEYYVYYKANDPDRQEREELKKVLILVSTGIVV